MLNHANEYRFIVRGFETEDELNTEVGRFTIKPKLTDEEIIQIQKDTKGDTTEALKKFSRSFIINNRKSRNSILTKAIKNYDPGMRIIYSNDYGWNVVCLGDQLFLMHGSRKWPYTLKKLYARWNDEKIKSNELNKELGWNDESSEELSESLITFKNHALNCIKESNEYLAGKRHV